MSTSQSQVPHGGVRIGRRVLHQLRASLERDTGLQASSYLQEAGFAGGEDMAYLSEALAEFFTDQGWGALTARPLGAVLALDAADWAEAGGGSSEFPSCHVTCGMLADFFGRMSNGLVAVMEVECRSRGDGRCRFLAGAPETLSALYDRMAQGAPYPEALGVSPDA